MHDLFVTRIDVKRVVHEAEKPWGNQHVVLNDNHFLVICEHLRDTARDRFHEAKILSPKVHLHFTTPSLACGDPTDLCNAPKTLCCLIQARTIHEYVQGRLGSQFVRTKRTKSPKRVVGAIEGEVRYRCERCQLQRVPVFNTVMLRSQPVNPSRVSRKDNLGPKDPSGPGDRLVNNQMT
jgi:hypothetical protein